MSDVLKRQRENQIENAVAELRKHCELRNGFIIDIDTLTGIKAQITDQVFYTVRPSEYLPVTVGENAFASNILTYTSAYTGQDFEKSLISPGTNDGRIQRADANISSITQETEYWANTINYNQIELQEAQRSGNWSLIESKERARITNWQLGIQRVAFLGLSGQKAAAFKGLLTQDNVTVNTATIPVDIKAMTETQFNTFLQTVINDAFANSNSTVYPDTFVIPTQDYNGLASAVSEQFPLKSRLERMLESFKVITGNQNFEIKPLVYGNSSQNEIDGPAGKNRYVMYRRSESDALRMDIPVDYIPTVHDTIDGFSYSSVGYAQFTGVEAFRPAQMIYFDRT